MRNLTQTPSTPKNAVILTKGSEKKPDAYQDRQRINQAESSNQAPKKQKLQSVFNLTKSINGKKAIICTALTGEQAINLVNALKDELNSPLFIKYAGMEVAR